MEFRQITFEIKNRVARIGFGKYSKKPRTTLELETLEELDIVLKEIEEKQKDDIIGLVFFSHKKNVFLAGMNVTVIRDLVTVQDGINGAIQGQEILCQIEDLAIPTIACVDGICIGGGTELALACKTIAVSDSPYTVLGVPEVQLGLLPAFGGTYRLPRKIGLPIALDLMLSGRMVTGIAAKKMGLVDQIYPEEKLVEMAISEYIINRKEKIDSEGQAKSYGMDNSPSSETIFENARESVLKKSGGHYKTPFRIIDHMESSYGKSRSVYLESEAQLLGEIAISREARNLQNIYFLHANSQKYSGPSGDKEKLILKKGAVLGAGTMGTKIAWLMARNNMTSIMKDINTAALESGLKQTAAIFSETVKRKKISEEESRLKQESIKTQLNYDGFKGIDLVSEAIVEDMGIKKNVLCEIESEIGEDCLITSSTSSLSINEMASVLSKPERFAGLHFFNPLNRVLLVEIITHDQIAPATISALYEWVIKIKKVPVVIKDGPGFLVNRILASYINESLYLLDVGVPIDELEQACLNFGMPMGPCHLLDDMGIDAGQGIINILNEAIGERFKPAEIYGKLSGLGRKSELNEEISQLLPVQKNKMSEDDIQKRIIIPMINEAAYVLQDQVAETVEDIDLALVFGAGFPRFRGGLLKYADILGPDYILRMLDQCAKNVDQKRFEACSLIKVMAEKNIKFYDWEREE